MTPQQKIEKTLENPTLTPGRKKTLEGILRLVKLNPLVYPTDAQTKIVNGLYKSHGQSETEKSVRELLGL